MKISRRQIRSMLNEAIMLNERITINMENSPSFTSKEDSSTGKARYVHQLHQLDRIVRRIGKIVKASLKKGKGKEDHVGKILALLDKSFIKDASGKKIKIAQKHEKGSFYDNVFQNYINFGNAFYANGGESFEDAISAASIKNLSDLPDKAPAQNLKGKALVQKKDGKGYEIKSTGQAKDSDIITIDFKGAKIDGVDASGTIKLTDLFRDVLTGQKVLQMGSGRKWIKGSKKTEDQTEWMQVKALQGLLLSMQGDPAKGLFTDTDGDYGSKTKKAVQNMQRMLKLKVDGAVGQQTASALNPKVTGSKVPITGAGDMPDEVAEKIGLKEAVRSRARKLKLRKLISRL